VVTSFAVLTRRAGLSHHEFRAHWRDVHAPLVRHVDYLRGYVQHRFVEPDAQARSADRLDGLAEFWWDDRPAALRPTTDPRYTEYAQPDEPRFLDTGRLQSVQTVPLRLGGSSINTTAARSVQLLFRRPDLANAEFHDRLATAWTVAAGGRGCMLHLAEIADDGTAPVVDAIVLCAWRDESARAWPDDGSDPARSLAFHDDAHVVLTPPVAEDQS
jgi:uncharacterized protein (TIGR02118 family)